MMGFSEFETAVFNEIVAWCHAKDIGILDITADSVDDETWNRHLTLQQAVDFYWEEYFSD